MTARPRPLADLPEQEALALADAYTLLDPMPAAVVEGCRSLIDAAMAEPVPCVTIRYRCPYCVRFSRSKKAAVTAHIARCWKNPAARACKTCRHFCQQDPEPQIGVPSAEWCDAGVTLPESGLVANCPLWALRGAS